LYEQEEEIDGLGHLEEVYEEGEVGSLAGLDPTPPSVNPANRRKVLDLKNT
jgi:hypothetical protein